MRHRSDPLPPPSSSVPAVAALIQRLLVRLNCRRAAAAPAAVTPPRHAPPGQRSGEGSDSLLPYLAEDLHSRPGSLGD